VKNAFTNPIYFNQVIVHLRSKSWETRVAAGQAIEAIAANVPEWAPPEEMKMEDSNSPPPTNTNDMDKLSFSTFDLSSVLAHGKLLLGSAGKEYDIDLSDMTPQERLALQRKNLKERLGLGSQFMDGNYNYEMLLFTRKYSDLSW
jgi:TATA-binding protein-associated factor